MRVVRALVECAPPFSVPQLVALSGASTGATYRVVEFLQEQALIERAARGPIEIVRWRRILERWSEDYGFLRSNTVRRYLQPRGLPALMAGLSAVQDVPVRRHGLACRTEVGTVRSAPCGNDLCR